jgi:hypothetical protein
LIEHRRAHIAAVGRDGQDDERQHRQREMLRPVEQEVEAVTRVDRAQLRGVEDAHVPFQEGVREDDLEDQG